MVDSKVRAKQPRFARQQCRAWIETRFCFGWRKPVDRFARQQCRAWIETFLMRALPRAVADSPGSNAGRGLKHATIERDALIWLDSPGSNAGRGLKPLHSLLYCRVCHDSPGSNAGRGLKLVQLHGRRFDGRIRPAAMPGVD